MDKKMIHYMVMIIAINASSYGQEDDPLYA